VSHTDRRSGAGRFSGRLRRSGETVGMRLCASPGPHLREDRTAWSGSGADDRMRARFGLPNDPSSFPAGVSGAGFLPAFRLRATAHRQHLAMARAEMKARPPDH
jgi:hypothetical protein